MIKTVIPNLRILFFRLVLLVVCIYIYQWPLEKIKSGQYLENQGLFWIGFSVVTIFPVYIVWTLSGVLWVTIFNDRMMIRFHYLFKKLDAYSSDIDGYYKTVNQTKVNTFKGFVIKMKSGKVVELAEYNLISIQQIQDFLRYIKVPFRGDVKSLFPFKLRI